MSVLATGVCAPGTNLENITSSACLFRIGEIQKILFQRKFSSGTTRNKFVIGTADPAEEASWTALTGASDGTKVTVSGWVENVGNEGGGPVTSGGGDESLGGEEVTVAYNPVNWTVSLNDKLALEIEGYKDLKNESFIINFNSSLGTLGLM